MNEIINLVQDFYFWMGAFVFIVSIYGMVWILKTLNKSHPKEMAVPQKTIPEPVPPIQSKIKTTSDKTAATLAGIPPVPNEQTPPPSKIESPASAVQPAHQNKDAGNELSLEQLAKQVEEMRETFQSSLSKLDRAHQEKNEKLSEDIKAILQILRSRAFEETLKREKEQINQVSSKMDQIYQVLSSLSKPEE